MTTALGEMVVRFKADLSDLTSKMGQAKGELSSFSSVSQSSSGSFLGNMKDMAGGMLDFGSKLGQTVFGIKNLADGALGLGSAFLEPAMQMEQMTTAFETLDGSASKATDEIQRLNSFAAKTPFQTMDIDQAAAQLQGFGVNVKDVVPDLTGMGDALSALGKATPGNLQQAVDALGKIQATGHLTGDSLQQLSDMGINATAILSKQLGVSTDQFRKMVSDGSIPAKTAIQDLVKGIEKSNLGGGMAKQAQTAAGQLSTLQSNAKLALASFSGPLLKMAEGGLEKLGQIAADPNFQKFATTLGTGIATGLSAIGTTIGTVVGWFQQMAQFFQQNQVAGDLLVGVLAGLTVGVIAMNGAAIIAAITSIPSMVVAFGAWAISAGAAAIATIAATWPILAIGAVVALVVAGIILAVQHWGQIMDWFKAVWGAITHWVGDQMSKLGSTLHIVISAIGSAFSGLGSMIKGIWDGIVGAVKGAINNIIGAINGFIGFIDGIQIHIPSIGVGPVQTPAFDWNGLGIPKIPYLAEGGFAKGWFVAGERGPELVYSAGGAQVYNSAQSRNMLGGFMPALANYPISPSVSSNVVTAGSSSAGSASRGDHTTVIELDSVVLAKITQSGTDRLVRLKLGAGGRAP